jgi:hypothetical protein
LQRLNRELEGEKPGLGVVEWKSSGSMMGEVEETTRGKRYAQRRPVNGDEAERQIDERKRSVGCSIGVKS